MIYDNFFNTIMGRYEENNAVGDRIWDMLVHGDEDNSNQTVDRTSTHQEITPQLHSDWLTTSEVNLRDS